MRHKPAIDESHIIFSVTGSQFASAVTSKQFSKIIRATKRCPTRWMNTSLRLVSRQKTYTMHPFEQRMLY